MTAQDGLRRCAEGSRLVRAGEEGGYALQGVRLFEDRRRMYSTLLDAETAYYQVRRLPRNTPPQNSAGPVKLLVYTRNVNRLLDSKRPPLLRNEKQDSRNEDFIYKQPSFVF